jgi:DNA polymerase-4
MLHYLAERAMRAARRLGLGVRSVETHLRYADGRAESGTRTLPEPTVLDEEVFEQVLASWRALHTRRVNVRLVGITLSRFVPERDFRGGLFADERRERKGRLYGALDRVRDRFGYGALVTGRSLDLVGKLRHDPHGFVLRTPSLTK